MKTSPFDQSVEVDIERVKLSAEFIHPQNLANLSRSCINPRAAIAQNNKIARLHRQARETAAILWLQVARAHWGETGQNLVGLTPMYYTIEWFFRGTRPDVDNVVARCKPLLDGAQNALKFNDRDLELGAVWRTHTTDTLDPMHHRTQICLYYHLVKDYENN